MAGKPAKAADGKPAEPGTKKKTKPAARSPDRKKKPEVKPPEKKKRRQPLTAAEWRKIRMEYIKGKTTFAKLAEKWNVSAGHIRKKASLERWSDKRRKLDTKTEQKTIERVSDARARELAKLAEIQDKVDDLIDFCVQAFSDIKPGKYDDMRGLESLTKAINTALATKRDLYSIPNETEKAKIESLREKAKLDRQRYEDEKAEKARLAAEAKNTMIRVVIQGESGGPLDE